jgi:hypothetical protein
LRVVLDESNVRVSGCTLTLPMARAYKSTVTSIFNGKVNLQMQTRSSRAVFEGPTQLNPVLFLYVLNIFEYTIDFKFVFYITHLNDVLIKIPKTVLFSLPKTNNSIKEGKWESSKAGIVFWERDKLSRFNETTNLQISLKIPPPSALLRLRLTSQSPGRIINYRASIDPASFKPLHSTQRRHMGVSVHKSA